MTTLRAFATALIRDGYGDLLWSGGADTWDAHGILEALHEDERAFDLGCDPVECRWVLYTGDDGQPAVIAHYLGGDTWDAVFGRR